MGLKRPHKHADAGESRRSMHVPAPISNQNLGEFLPQQNAGRSPIAAHPIADGVDIDEQYRFGLGPVRPPQDR